MATLTAEQFRKMFPQANNEPVTRALATGLQTIADPLNQYRLPESMPVVGGMSAADFTGLTGAQGVLQDFSRGNLQSGDMRMFDLLGVGAGAAPVAKTALKGGGLLGKEALRQMNEGTGLLGKVAIDPRMYAVTKTDYEKAFDLAQKRAALPVEEGGLGLPPTNTAMDRAKAMGFDTDKKWLHGTRSDFNEFSKTKDIGYHFGDKWQANDRAGTGYTSNVIPVYLKNKNIINTDDVYGSGSNFQIYGNLRDKGHISQDEIDNIFGTVIRADHDKALANLLKSKNYGGIEYDNMVEGIRTDLRNDGAKNIARIVLDPSQIRSPNAAFDPFRRNEADILAGLGVGVPSINFLDKEKPKKKK
jgi:hypothetical protein